MSDAHVHTFGVMGTVVTIHVVGHGADRQEQREREHAVGRAVAWFHQINDACTRFDAGSEIRRLCAQVGTPVSVSATVFQAVQFALAVADESGGAFDPTIGADAANYRDIVIDSHEMTITVCRPLVIDLGAVAKGLAVDMAARELRPFHNFAVDAGGDIYFGGCNADQSPWSVGVRHPRDQRQLLDTLHVSDMAVCTSGDYERPSPKGEGSHHILDPRTGTSATDVASVTVLAPTAMVADALGTAAFVLGPADGIALLERHGVEGLIVTPALERFETSGWRRGCHVARATPDASEISHES